MLEVLQAHLDFVGSHESNANKASAFKEIFSNSKSKGAEQEGRYLYLFLFTGN